MPVSQNDTRVSIDFKYVYNIPNSEEVITYVMKLTHSEFGPVITLAQEGQSEAIELPALMFVEVSQFLQARGALKAEPLAKDIPIVGGGRSLTGSSLKMPSVVSKKQVVTNYPPLTNLPLDMGSQLEEHVEEETEILTPVKHTVSKEETESFLKERQAALEDATRAKAEKNIGIKKRHRP